MADQYSQRERELQEWESDLVQKQDELDDAVAAFRDEMQRAIAELTRQRRQLDDVRAATDAREQEVALREEGVLALARRLQVAVADAQEAAGPSSAGVTPVKHDPSNTNGTGTRGAPAIPQLNFGVAAAAAASANTRYNEPSPARPMSAAPFHGRRGRVAKHEDSGITSPHSVDGRARHADPAAVIAQDGSASSVDSDTSADEVLHAVNDPSPKKPVARSHSFDDTAESDPAYDEEAEGDEEIADEEEEEQEEAYIVQGNAVMTTSGRMLDPTEAADVLVHSGIVTREEINSLVATGFSATVILAEHLLASQDEDERHAATARAGTPPEHSTRAAAGGHAWMEVPPEHDDGGQYDDYDDFDDEDEEEEEEEEHNISLT